MDNNLKTRIEYKSIRDLHPYEKNPRKNKDAIPLVAKSIEEFGFKVPIVVDKDDVIVCGHTRYFAAKKLGLTEAPCIIADDLSEEQIKAFRLADNKVAEAAEWDLDLLGSELADIVDIDMEDFGFDLGDFEEESEAVEDDFDEPLPEEPTSKLGQIYQLGNHRLMCGDSTSEEDVQKLTGGAMIDLLITDPPYNVDYTGKTKDALKIENDKMEDGNFRQFLIDAFKAADSVMKPGAVFYIWHADSEGYNFRGACKEAGWPVRQCLIWNKNVMVMGRQDYQWKHEPCQPAGTMVWTPNGAVPIEELKDGDTVVSFDTYSGAVKGYREGYRVKTANRHYNGTIYGVVADNLKTRATDNHEFSVRFNPNTSEVYCTYLMRKGKWWRVGITRTYDARGFGLKHRVDQEKAEEAWLIDTYKSKADAQMGEQLISIKYGIPYTHWETERGVINEYSTRTTNQIEWLYNNIDLNELQKNAERLLTDYGRQLKYPLIDGKSKRQKYSRRVTARINACNLIPGLMQVPVPNKQYEGTETFKWVSISNIEREAFDGTVYSLAVENLQHYIADGIVTHNCLYGWKEGAGHLWASDRKQTTVINFDKPVRSELHPTMKPIGLFDYQIKNNTKGGDAVLDLFGGSGTTIMACEQNGRKAYSMELDPRYVDVIIKRWETFTGEKAVLLNGDN